MNASRRWRDLARALRRAVLGPGTADLLSRTYRVAYGGRGMAGDVDLAPCADLATGRQTIFDVGANVGAWTLALQERAAERSRTVAFEASEAACRLLAETLRLNGLEHRVEIVNAAVSDRSGSVAILRGSGAEGDASIVERFRTGGPRLARATLSLDDFAAERRLAPELIKIDVEGAETLVLDGARRILEVDRPDVVVEAHGWPGVSLRENVAAIEELAAATRYRVFDLVDGGPVVDAVLRSAPRRHLLLAPSERGWPNVLGGRA